jgi:carbon-monoxide dehydrogenase iron sulfur subunit
MKIFCDTRRCLGCGSCELACAVEHSSSKDLFEAILEEKLPLQRIEVQALPEGNISLRCQHCDDAPCVAACISGAMVKKEDATICNVDKCIGCWMCIMACPFGVIFPDEVAITCDLCPDRDEYACVQACPTKALFVGEFEEFEKELEEVL